MDSDTAKNLETSEFQYQILTLLEARNTQALRTLVQNGEDVFNGLDLRKRDLQGLDLESFDLSGADLSGADLSGANLKETKLPTELKSVKLKGACLQGVTFHNVTLENIDASGADLSGTKFLAARLSEVNFSGANLQDAELKDCTMTKTIFCNADIRRAVIAGTTFNDADFKGVNWGEDNPEDRPIFTRYLMIIPPGESLDAEIKEPIDAPFQAYLDAQDSVEAEADRMAQEISEKSEQRSLDDDMDIEGLSLKDIRAFMKNLDGLDDVDPEGVKDAEKLIKGLEDLNDKYGKN